MVHHLSVLGSREVGMCCAVCVCVCFSMHFFVLLTSRRCRAIGVAESHASSGRSTPLKELLPETSSRITLHPVCHDRKIHGQMRLRRDAPSRANIAFAHAREYAKRLVACLPRKHM